VRPQTRYARSGDVSIAYQVVGDGPLDLILVHGWVSHLDMQWGERRLAAFLNRLASFARLIVFDKRGTGLSDRVATADLPTLEERMDDLGAVMDAAGSENAALFGISDGGAMCLLFAATHPERVRSVLTFGSWARRTFAPDYPWASTREKREARYSEIPETWGTSASLFGLKTLFPSMVGDHAFEDWLGAYLRAAASPAAAVAILRMNSDADVRPILASVRVPALVMNRVDDGDVKVDEARYLASHIPGARLKLFSGADHVPWIGHTEDILGEIEEFLTGARHVDFEDRVLATVLSTDIVASTELVARLGDRNWRDLLERHYAAVRRRLEQYRGREIDTAGDGVLAAFDGPARAIRCAKAVVGDSASLGFEMRAGLHTGECEVVGGKLTGIAVHTAARVAATASPGEVLVSATVHDLVAGSGITFAERGEHALKGITASAAAVRS